MEQPHGKAMTWTGRILVALVGLFMAFDSLIKVVGMDVVTESFVRLGYDGGVGQAIGLIEVVATLLYLWPRTAVLGAALLTEVIARARQRGIRRLFLEMRRNNPAGKLYTGFGFRTVGVRPGYYRTASGERLDALSQELHLADN